MKTSHIGLLTVMWLAHAGTVAHAQAQAVQTTPSGAVFRCPDNYYTDNAKEAKEKNCRVVTEAQITIIASTKVAAPAQRAAGSGGSAGSPASGDTRVEGTKQRERDSDRRRILNDELAQAEAKLADLRKDFNNGEPEKRGSEARNYQSYLDRITQMRSDISRSEADITALRREITNLRD
jgi:hypothetical protein